MSAGWTAARALEARVRELLKANAEMAELWVEQEVRIGTLENALGDVIARHHAIPDPSRDWSGCSACGKASALLKSAAP